MLKEITITSNSIIELYKELLREFKILENQLNIAEENGVTFNQVHPKAVEIEEEKNKLENFINK